MPASASRYGHAKTTPKIGAIAPFALRGAGRSPIRGGWPPFFAPMPATGYPPTGSARRRVLPTTRGMGRMRGAGLVATVVISGGLWLFARGHGPTAPAGVPVYCADVTRVMVVATDDRQTGGSGGPAEA